MMRLMAGHCAASVSATVFGAATDRVYSTASKCEVLPGLSPDADSSVLSDVCSWGSCRAAHVRVELFLAAS